MNDYSKLIGQAKTIIDHGFSRVGRGLNASSKAERALMLLSSRALSIANALILLAEHEHANEALPLLRSLFEIGVAMRWITQEDREKRGRDILEEVVNVDWAGLWQTGRLRKRMTELDFPEAVWGGHVYKRILEFCYEYMHANVRDLPWGHIFDDEKSRGVGSEELLSFAVYALGHVVKALDVRWPGKFEGAEKLWEKAKVA